VACDLTKNRKRIGWQYQQNANAPCKCQLGYQFDGSLANEWWIEWDTPQVDARMLWLDGGNKATYSPLLSGADFCIFLFGNVLTISIQFLIRGVNYPLQDPGFGAWSVTYSLTVGNIDVTNPPVSKIEYGETHALWPPANFDPDIFCDQSIFPPGLPPVIVGQATVTPLRCGHAC
jgi:hypothetical protein